MGRAGFQVYTVFFFRRFVGDQTQTSLGQTSNDATYDVYSSVAGKTFNELKIYEYSTLCLCKIHCLFVLLKRLIRSEC